MQTDGLETGAVLACLDDSLWTRRYTRGRPSGVCSIPGKEEAFAVPLKIWKDSVWCICHCSCLCSRAFSKGAGGAQQRREGGGLHHASAPLVALRRGGPLWLQQPPLLCLPAGMLHLLLSHAQAPLFSAQAAQVNPGRRKSETGREQPWPCSCLPPGLRWAGSRLTAWPVS